MTTNMPGETAPPTLLIVRSLQQSSVGCREFREAIPGEELLQRFSHRCGGEWDMRGQKLCETWGLYFPDHKIFKRGTHRAVFYGSTLQGRGIQRGAPSPNNVH
jgi:hypothetical protein